MTAQLRGWIAAALLAVSALLPFALLEHDGNSTATWSSGRIASGRSDPPVYLLHGQVSDFGGGAGNRILAVATEDGLYARHGIPWSVARFGSFLFVPLLAICAIALGFMNRWVLILALSAASWLLFANLVGYEMHFVLFHTPPHSREIAYDFDTAKLIRIEKGTMFIYDFGRSPPVALPLFDSKWENRSGNMGEIWGYYPKWGVSRFVAVTAGLITPSLLLIAASLLAMRRIMNGLQRRQNEY